VTESTNTLNAELDLEVQDVSDASWDDLVSQMMRDELDAMALATCKPACTCNSTCGCGSGC